MSSLETQKNRKKTVSATTRKKTGTTSRSKKTTTTPVAPPEPTRDEIARRAYELFLARGRAHGHSAEDWYRAEQELKSQRAKALGGKSDRGSTKSDA